MFISVIVLYIVPQGRVAYWADWRFWGLTKSQWGNIHLNVGLLFLLSIFLHIYYNWKPLLNYLKNKARQLKVLTREFNAALLLTLMVAIGTFFEVVPFSWVLELNEQIKDNAAAKYGEPPYGHAELSTLKAFALKTGIDLAASMAQLHQKNIAASADMTIKQIARQHDMAPTDVYTLLRKIAANHGS